MAETAQVPSNRVYYYLNTDTNKWRPLAGTSAGVNSSGATTVTVAELDTVPDARILYYLDTTTNQWSPVKGNSAGIFVN